MSGVRYSYEFKTFKTGRREGQQYVNIRDVKTGKTIRTQSSKASLQKAHKSHGQQKRRGVKLESWNRISDKVEKQGGNRKQYEKAIKNLKAKGIKSKKAEAKAIALTGYSTYARFFYQSSSSKDVIPYTIGESNPDYDVGIEYDTYQAKLSGNELKNNLEWFDQVYDSTLEGIKDSEQVLHYGGYEIQVKDNETGKTIDYTTKGGNYPLKQGKITKTTRTRSKDEETRF